MTLKPVPDGVPEFSVSVSLLFLLYINDVPKITSTEVNNNTSTLILFANDTCLNITSSNPANLIEVIEGTFNDINNWFNAKLWSLNFEHKQVSYNF